MTSKKIIDFFEKQFAFEMYKSKPKLDSTNKVGALAEYDHNIDFYSDEDRVMQIVMNYESNCFLDVANFFHDFSQMIEINNCGKVIFNDNGIVLCSTQIKHDYYTSDINMIVHSFEQPNGEDKYHFMLKISGLISHVLQTK